MWLNGYIIAERVKNKDIGTENNTCTRNKMCLRMKTMRSYGLCDEVIWFCADSLLKWKCSVPQVYF